MKKAVRILFTVVLFALLSAFSMLAASCGNDSGDESHEHAYGTEWSYDSTEHWHATTCGHVGVVADKAEHSYTDGTVQPTCTEKGYAEHKCACGYGYRDSETPALGHDLTEISRKASDCTVNGWVEYECSRCDYVTKQESALDQTAHSFDDGHYVYNSSKHWYAATCGHASAKYGEQEHTYTDETQAPTCTEIGYTEHTCVCGYNFRDSEVPALGHNPVEISRKASTCSKYGYVESACDRCGENLIQSLELDPDDHSYSAEWTFDGNNHWHAASCIHASEKTDVQAHTLTSRVIAPTCSARGYTASACDCGYEIIDENSYTDTISHTYATGNNWTKTAAYHYHAATCGTDKAHKAMAGDKAGHTFNQNNVCTVCNYQLEYTQGLNFGYGKGGGLKVSGADTAASEIVIPAYVEYDGQTMPVTEIGQSAFMNNNNITSVIIPNTVTTITNQAFSSCSNLKYIYIPGSVTSISSAQVFEGSKKLTTVEVDENNAAYKMDANCLIKKSNNELVAVFGKYTIPDYVTTLGSRVFANAAFTEFTMPANIITINGSAFNSCKSLVSVTFNNVKTINESAFSGCSALTSIDLTNVETVGNASFQGCTSLATINFGSKLKTLNEFAFKNCPARATITVDGGNSTFRASDNCLLKGSAVVLGGVQSVIPEGVTEIGKKAFWYAAPAQIVLANNIITIGEGAFSYSQLTSVSIPGSVATVSKQAFEYCGELSSLELCEGITVIQQYAFRGCNSLHTVTIPASMTKIGGEAFTIGAYEEGGLTSATFVDKTGWKCGGKDVNFDDPNFDVCDRLKYGTWTHTA